MTVIATGAGTFFGLALAMLAAFFRTQDVRYDRLAEWSFVAFALLGVPTILATAGLLPVHQVAVPVLTGLGVAGVVALGVGEAGTTLGILDFRRIAVPVTIAFVAFLVWIGGVSVLVVLDGRLGAGVGWLGIVTILSGLGTTGWMAARRGVLTGERAPSTAQVAVLLLVVVGIVGWMVWLGFSLSATGSIGDA